MEPEVHIAEKWLQLVHRCFTVTNIKASGNKEIDILAINPRKKNGFVHVECKCQIGHLLDIRKPFNHNGRNYKNELEYFVKEKFQHPKVLKRIKEFFGSKPYTKTLIVWDFEHTLQPITWEKYGIELRTFEEIVREIHEQIKQDSRGYRDDVLRIIELFVSEEELSEKHFKWMQNEAKKLKMGGKMLSKQAKNKTK